MKETEMSKLTIEELNKRNESLKLKTGMLVGLFFVLLCAGVYVTITDLKFLPVLMMAVALLPLVIVSFGQMKKIASEIAGRNK